MHNLRTLLWLGLGTLLVNVCWSCSSPADSSRDGPGNQDSATIAEAGWRTERRKIVEELLHHAPRKFESIMIAHVPEGNESHPSWLISRLSLRESDLTSELAKAKAIAVVSTGRDFASKGIGGGDLVGAVVLRFENSLAAVLAKLRLSRKWRDENSPAHPTFTKVYYPRGGGAAVSENPPERVVFVDDRTLQFLTHPELIQTSGEDNGGTLARLAQWASFSDVPLDGSEDFVLYRKYDLNNPADAYSPVNTNYPNILPGTRGFRIEGFCLQFNEPGTLDFVLTVQSKDPRAARAFFADGLLSRSDKDEFYDPASSEDECAVQIKSDVVGENSFRVTGEYKLTADGPLYLLQIMIAFGLNIFI